MIMHERTRELLFLVFGDVVVFSGALWLTLLIRYRSLPSYELFDTHLGPFLILSGIWIVVFYIAGLYDKHTLSLKRHLFSRIINTQFVNIIIAIFVFWFVPFGIAPKTNLAIYFVISILLMTWWRSVLAPRMKHTKRQKALLIASGEDARELAHEINNNSRYAYEFVFVCSPKNTDNEAEHIESVRRCLADGDVDTVVANPHDPSTHAIIAAVFEDAVNGQAYTFIDFARMYENVFDRVPLSAVGYAWFITYVSQARRPLYRFAKRTMDIIGSLIILCLLGVMLPFIALIMRLEGRGPVFIAQDRVGRFGKRISIYKLRTMTKNDRASASWVSEGAAKENVVTRFGRILRHTSIDEWPQALAILRGDMSLIGPRSDILGIWERSARDIPYFNIRYFVQPGVTGWAQTHQQYIGKNISPQSLEETRIKFSYDLYYIKHRSLLLDIEIAIRTLKTLISRFGIRIV